MRSGLSSWNTGFHSPDKSICPNTTNGKKAMSTIKRFISLLLHLARKISGFVGATRTIVNSHLRIETQWTCAIRLAAANARRLDAIRSFALLYPFADRDHHTECAGPVADRAVPHPRDHEQADRIRHGGLA